MSIEANNDKIGTGGNNGYGSSTLNDTETNTWCRLGSIYVEKSERESEFFI